MIEEEFIQLVVQRGKAGAEEYGEFAYMKNNTLDMMFEELADIVNYCRFTYIKLRLFKEVVDNALSAHSTRTDVGGDHS